MRSWSEIPGVMLVPVCLFTVITLTETTAANDDQQQLRQADRVRIAEAFRIANQL